MDERTAKGDATPRSVGRRDPGPYPRRLIAASARLLEIQYALWERDLRDPEQPLTEYGFRLSPDSSGIDGRACRYDSSDGLATIILDSMLVHGRPGGQAVGIDRRTLAISTAWIHEWSPTARLTHGTPAQADLLVPRLISWIGGYEQWVVDSCADTRRRSSVRQMHLDDELPALWWRLATEWRAALATTPLAR